MLLGVRLRSDGVREGVPVTCEEKIEEDKENGPGFSPPIDAGVNWKGMEVVEDDWSWLVEGKGYEG